MSLVQSTATELLAQLEAGSISAVELTRAYLDQIERLDGRCQSVSARRCRRGACGRRPTSIAAGRPAAGRAAGRVARGGQGSALHARAS